MLWWGGYTLVSMIILSIILGVLGVAILIVGVLSVTGTLPGNPVVGLRIPEVRKSQEYWIMGHKIAGPAWAGSGLALLASAAVAWQAAGWLWLVVGLLVVAAVFLLGLGAALAGHAMATIDARAEKEAEASATCCSAGSSSDSDATSAATGDACCSADAPAAGADGVVSAEACASGQACGSCSLNGSCEGGGAAFDSCQSDAAGASAAGAPAQPAAPKPALDLDAARRAAATQDER